MESPRRRTFAPQKKIGRRLLRRVSRCVAGVPSRLAAPHANQHGPLAPRNGTEQAARHESMCVAAAVVGAHERFKVLRQGVRGEGGRNVVFRDHAQLEQCDPRVEDDVADLIAHLDAKEVFHHRVRVAAPRERMEKVLHARLDIFAARRWEAGWEQASRGFRLGVDDEWHCVFRLASVGALALVRPPPSPI